MAGQRTQPRLAESQRFYNQVAAFAAFLEFAEFADFPDFAAFADFADFADVANFLLFLGLLNARFCWILLTGSLTNHR